jgi:predicted glycoside hydrolase/deacetylase ChbG (UPF0249 family)
MTTSHRYLIVNADDFGQSRGINRGIIQAYERGIVTSASLMVWGQAAAEAAAYAHAQPKLSLGLHVDLGEWTYRGNEWVPVYELVPADDDQAVAGEAERQLAAFRRLVGADPTHLDSHQHVHRENGMRPIFAEIARRLSIPLRSVSPEVPYCGNFYGQDEKGQSFSKLISVDALIKILAELPRGVTELGCHPGKGNDFESKYRGERAQEVKTLCDPQVRAAVASMGITLCSFRDVTVRRSNVPLEAAPPER